jgi:hypothetical protein
MGTSVEDGCRGVYPNAATRTSAVQPATLISPDPRFW